MTCDLVALCSDANDPLRLALLPSDDTGFRLRFLPSKELKEGPNEMHFDLTSASSEMQEQTVARAANLAERDHLTRQATRLNTGG